MKNKTYNPQRVKMSKSGKSICFKPKESRWWHYIPLSKQELSGESIIKLLNLNLITIDLDDTTFQRGWVRVEKYSLTKKPTTKTNKTKITKSKTTRTSKIKTKHNNKIEKLITLKKGDDFSQEVVEYALENNLNFIKKNEVLFIENPITNRLLSFENWLIKFGDIR